MLSEYIDRGMRTIEEWERSVLDDVDIKLADKLLDQLVKINRMIASTPAIDLKEMAMKSDYVKILAADDPAPAIGEMEWCVIASLMDDILRLANQQLSMPEQSNSNL